MSFRTTLVVTAFLLVAFLACVSQAQDAFPQPAGWPRILSATSDSEEIAPAVHYVRWRLRTDAGPLVVSIATIDLHDPNVGITVATHNGMIVGKGERLSAMADRSAADVGVNADYFDINETGSPLNLVTVDGRVLHQPDRAAVFSLLPGNAILMGAVSLAVHLGADTGPTRDIVTINESSPSVGIAVVTAELGTDQAFDATEMVLSPQGAAGKYSVARIDANLAKLEQLAPSEIGIVVRGPQAQALVQDFKVGDGITVSVQSEPDVSAAQAAVGGGPLLVKDGQAWQDPAPPAPEENDVRNPVTGAGVSQNGRTLWLVVVDGRRRSLSIGLTRPQLASLFLSLGAWNAMAFDSGGSSEMVVRHLGDVTTSVANSPSDGRERAIADGLFIRNLASPGPPTRLILKAASAAVLAGSHLGVTVHAVDANDQPISINDPEFSVVPDAVAAVDAKGTFVGKSPGLATLTARASGLEVQSQIRVVPSIDKLSILPEHPIIVAGGQLQLIAFARSSDGEPISIDQSAVRWSSSSGKMLTDGTFVGPGRAASSIVRAQVGNTVAHTVVLSGEHAVTMQAIPKAGSSAGEWHYQSRPAAVPGGVDNMPAPDNAAALRLAYDFSTQTGIRAAYAENAIVLPGEPLAFAVEVYGDANGAWLRAGYRNADGNNQSLTLARRIDWRGWKTIKVTLPPQAAWPITLSRLYVLERAPEGREQGSIWFRNIRLFLAGPSS